jgi:hypothetical protein
MTQDGISVADPCRQILIPEEKTHLLCQKQRNIRPEHEKISLTVHETIDLLFIPAQEIPVGIEKIENRCFRREVSPGSEKAVKLIGDFPVTVGFLKVKTLCSEGDL